MNMRKVFAKITDALYTLGHVAVGMWTKAFEISPLGAIVMFVMVVMCIVAFVFK